MPGVGLTDRAPATESSPEFFAAIIF